MDKKDDRVMAYVCDGKSVASWFTGKAADDGTISLTSADGVRLSGRLVGDRLTGSLVLPNGGATLKFSTAEVESPAGLYRSKHWVVPWTRIPALVRHHSSARRWASSRSTKCSPANSEPRT